MYKESKNINKLKQQDRIEYLIKQIYPILTGTVGLITLIGFIIISAIYMNNYRFIISLIAIILGSCLFVIIMYISSKWTENIKKEYFKIEAK